MRSALLTSPEPCSPSGYPRTLNLEPEALDGMKGLPGNVPVMSRGHPTLPEMNGPSHLKLEELCNKT